MKNFKIGQHSTRVALVQYSTKSRVEFNFKANSNRKQLMRAIRKVSYMKGGTYTHRALADVETLFKSRRRKASNIAIILTDGRSKSPKLTKKAAKRLHQKKIKVFVVGIGRKLNAAELRAMASRPTKRHTYRAVNFRALGKIAKPLRRAACRG